MKKTISILLVALLLVGTFIVPSADDVVGNTYNIDNKTIIFDADSAFTIEEQQHIAQIIVTPENNATTYGLICTLFGHNNTTESVAAITHCVNEQSPRCLKEYFIVTTCSRCDESTVERASYCYITCCPED